MTIAVIICSAQLQAQEVSFLFMGDFMQHEEQLSVAKSDSNKYDYSDYFKYTGQLINGVDVCVANLEVTLAGSPYSGYPQFCAPDEFAEAIQNAGVDILTTANNHSNDKRKKGLERTISVLDSIGILHLGTYVDSIERSSNYPLIIDKNGIRVALLNYTYGTNGIHTKPPNVVNMIDENLIRGDIQKAKEIGVDKIIGIMHWGKEYLSHPDAYQRKWGQFLLDNGCDIVIGGHPHWVQPIEFKRDTTSKSSTLVAWSLGNIVSNQRRRHTDGGLSLQLSLFRDTKGKVMIKDVGYHLHWVWVNNDQGKKHFHILPVSYIEKMGANLSAEDLKSFNRFIGDERNLLSNSNINVDEYEFNVETGEYILR